MIRHLFLSVALTGVVCAGFGQRPAKKKPNILFILADDQGYGDLGAFYQNERARLNDHSKPFEVTPHLDRMAGEGAMLTQ
jgi:arylsulfatase A-like enzyme